MSALSRIALVGMIGLTMAGCGSGDNQSVAPTPSPSQVAKSPQAKAAKPTKSPGASPQPTATLPAAPGLIQPTNPQERAKTVIKGRTDPFAILPGEVVPPSTSSTPAPQKPVPQLPNLPTAVPTGVPSRKPPVIVGVPIPPKNRQIAQRPRNKPVTPNGSINGPIALKPNPSLQPKFSPVVPSTPLLPSVPPPPATEAASAILVTGVAQVGDETEAIVKVPNEPTSRYVRVGQRLSNGQVFVKRIEMNEGAVPVVVLEQDGIEVSRAVGEQPAKTGATPTAAIPGNPLFTGT